MSNHWLLHHHPILSSSWYLLVAGLLRYVFASLVLTMVLQEQFNSTINHSRRRYHRFRDSAYIFEEAEAGLGADHHPAALYGELSHRTGRRNHRDRDNRHLSNIIRPHQGRIRQRHHGYHVLIMITYYGSCNSNHSNIGHPPGPTGKRSQGSL